MCNLARGFNRNVLHFLRLRRAYLEIESPPDAQCLQWYIVAGSPNAHRFAISGLAGRQTSICGMLSRDTEFLRPATDKVPRCRNCERS
jgi:hypothetical protein